MIYGGGNYGSVGGNTSVTVTGGTVEYGIVGGCGAGTVTGSTNVTVTGGTFYSSVYLSNVYGGGYGGYVAGSTNVAITGGTINGSVYGGGNTGSVAGGATVSIGVDASITGAVNYGCLNSGATVGAGSKVIYEVAFYDANGGSKYTADPYPPQWITSGGTATKPSTDPTQSGKVFSAWKKVSDNSAYDFGAAVTSAVKLYPGWCTAPTVTTTAAASVTSSSATLGGNVTADGGTSVLLRGVVYSSTNAIPEIETDSELHAGNGTGTFSESITGLAANTTYYVRAFATNSAGTGYGDVVQFTTALTYWKDNAVPAYAGGDGTSASPYLISTAEQLAYFSNQVNAGNNYSGQYFKLTADISLAGKQWTPIGESQANYYFFNGTFDGDGHKIT
jgi:hypothetical protein